MSQVDNDRSAVTYAGRIPDQVKFVLKANEEHRKRLYELQHGVQRGRRALADGVLDSLLFVLTPQERAYVLGRRDPLVELDFEERERLAYVLRHCHVHVPGRKGDADIIKKLKARP